MTDKEFQRISVLIPGYSIEDLPTDLNEKQASSLFNAFATAWHPLLLNSSAAIPDFRQAESSELPIGPQVLLVPECSEDWMGHDWRERLHESQCIVVADCCDRQEYVDAIVGHFNVSPTAMDDDLLADFFALGTAHLQVSLLSRRMHHYVDPDAFLLENETMAAAEAAMAGDANLAKEHLRRCFECLLDCREQFYPVDCYLLDVCLPSEQTTAAQLIRLCKDTPALSLVCSGRELRGHCDTDSEFRNMLSESVACGRLSLICGHAHELRASLSGAGTAYADMTSNAEWLRSLLGDADLHWGRRRFGMTSNFPAMMVSAGYSSAVHVALDDGIYPDREFGQLLWEAADGTTIPATSRIPMAIDGSSSFQRFSDRMTESMQEDTNAVMFLARLPELQTPWLADMKRAASYAPVLGRFVTLTEYVDLTSGQASATRFDEGEYLSPYLIQSSVLKTEAPVSSPAQLHLQRTRLNSYSLLYAAATVLNPTSEARGSVDSLLAECDFEELRRIDAELNECDSVDEQAKRLSEITQKVDTESCVVAEFLASQIPGKETNADGLLIFNPTPWRREATVDWPQKLAPVAKCSAIVDAWMQDEQLRVVVDIPPGGFLWLLESENGNAHELSKDSGKPLAESFVLRNQFFEVELSDSTGGIASVRFHGQRANRVSQHVAYRYDFAKKIVVDDEEVNVHYATTRMLSSKVLATGPFVGAVETNCEIVDVVSGDVLASFRQTVSVERNSLRLGIRIVFDDIPGSPTGNPWMTYIASRFAWENEASSITRSMLGQAHGFRQERFEAPDYVEVADADQRLLILPHGRPYHRRSGHRMLDSFLVVEGEPERSFDFTVEFNQPFPMRSALEIGQPAVVTPTSARGPVSSDRGGLIGVSAKNVSVAGIRREEADGKTTVVLLLQETEGRPGRCRITTARPIRSARHRLADGSTVNQLIVTDGVASLEFSRFQLKEVELAF